MGARSRNLGEGLENLLNIYHNALRDEGFFIHKNPTATILRNGRWIPMPALPDYVAAAPPNGTMISFDAKFRSKPVWRQGTDQRHQAQYLRDIWQAGGVGFFLFMIDWDRGYLAWPQSYWSRDESFTLDLESAPPEIAIPVPAWAGAHGTYIPDWREAIGETLNERRRRE